MASFQLEVLTVPVELGKAKECSAMLLYELSHGVKNSPCMLICVDIDSTPATPTVLSLTIERGEFERGLLVHNKWANVNWLPSFHASSGRTPDISFPLPTCSFRSGEHPTTHTPHCLSNWDRINVFSKLVRSLINCYWHLHPALGLV